MTDASLHVFSDASSYGYGVGIYLRQENVRGQVCLAVVMGKSRVVPLEGETIVRSELVAATLKLDVERYHYIDSELVD